MRTIELTMVVLPTPGSPVMTNALLANASRIATRWLSASLRPLRSATRGPLEIERRPDQVRRRSE
jgi:hypothetical protein